MKVDYQILYFALIRRAILWLLVSFGFLFSLDFIVRLIIEQSTKNFFQLPNLLNMFLFGCWNMFYTTFTIFQVHHLGGVPSPISTLQERWRAIVLTLLYSVFSVLLLFPFFNSSNIKTSWSTLTLPILSSTILMLRIYFTEPISFILESTQNKTSFITEFLQTLKNTAQKIIPSILYFSSAFLTVKLVITVWELVIRDNILVKLPYLDNFHKLVHLVKTTIVTKEIVLVALLIMIFVHLSYAVFRDLAVYVLSLPIDFLKLQPQPNLKLAKEHLLMTSISNHTQESHNSIYEGVTVSLQECYEEYQQREGSSTTAYELNSKNRGRGLKSQLFTIYQKDITTTIPVSEFICHYYQRKLQETYQTMKSNTVDSEEDGVNQLSLSNDTSKDKEENSSGSYFPISSFLHPWKNESFFDFFKHGFAYVTSFQYSLYYFFRCFGWNDVNQIAKDPSLYFRRNSLYEHHWNQMMNQGFQVLLATIIQMNILSDYIQASNPLRLQYEKVEKKENDSKNRDEDQEKSKDLRNEKESIDILDQIAQLKAKLQPNASSRPLTAESIEVSLGKHYILPPPIRFLLSFIPKQFQSKISSMIRKFMKKLNEKYQLNRLFNKLLLPIFNKYIFYFPQKNEFISNQILSINSIQYFQYYFSPLYCQNLINIIESITLLYHSALNEDEKGVTLVTLPTFFLFLLQLDITLLEYLEFCQPQFLLNSPNSYSYQNGNSNRNNNNMTPQQQQQLPRRYKQRSIKQLPNHLMQLSNVVKEMIGRILVDYSDLLSISQSTVASSQRNHIFNLNIYSKEIIERIRYHEEEMRLPQEKKPQGETVEVN